MLKIGEILVIGWIGCVMAGCGKPGNYASNFTNSVVTLVSINDSKPLQSDVVSKGVGADDVVKVKLKSTLRTPTDDPTRPDGTTAFDVVTFRRYLVTHARSDGGACPTAFSGGILLVLQPDSEAEINVVIVRAFDKHRAPLEQLRDDGELFTTTTITFYGEDGYGNDVAIGGSLTISFANFLDQ